jgi:transposase
MDGRRYSTAEVRVRAVVAVQKGMTVSQTAMTFGVDRTTLHRWLARYDQNGEAGLQRRPVRGRPRKLGRVTAERLKRIVLAPATKFGFETELWTVGRLHAVLVDRLKADVSEDTVWRRLREAGLTWQTPERQYFEADPETRRRWQEETIPKIRETLENNRWNPLLRRRGLGLPDAAAGQDLGRTRQASQSTRDGCAGQHRGDVGDQSHRTIGISTARQAYNFGGSN